MPSTDADAPPLHHVQLDDGTTFAYRELGTRAARRPGAGVQPPPPDRSGAAVLLLHGRPT